MEKLIKQKELLERDLKINIEKYNELVGDENEIKERLDTLKVNRSIYLEKYENVKEKLKQKKVLFIKLKSKIKTYKVHKYEEIREIYINKYKKIINDINKIQWKYNLQIFASFDLLNEIISEACNFKNLKKHLIEFQKSQKNSLKDFILGEVLKNKEIHNMIYFLKFIKQYEKYFKQDLFLESMNEYISRRYKYHFLGDNETNRLDKAEWIFNFLEKKIKEVWKLLGIYNSLDQKNEQDVKKFMHSVLKNVVNHLNIKIIELEEIESTQKRNILLNFNYFMNIFLKNILTEYSINIEGKFDDFKDYLINQEKRLFTLKLQNIHKMNYKDWFIKYEEILKELLDLNKKHLYFNINFVLDNIIEFNLVFIDSMRYINRKEIHVLIFLYNMFEEFKETVQFLLEEFNQDDSISINEETTDGILMKISKFNLENFKLIKSLFENDINNILNLKFYFINDLYIVLDDYKKCKGYNKLKLLASDMIDKYLFNTLKYRKLEKHEYLDYLNLFKKLKDVFEVKKWESRECMKCIKGIYEKKNIENKYMEEISNLYRY